MSKQPCVYMLSSQRNGTLYIGVTSDLIKRVYQYRMALVDGFTKRYGVHSVDRKIQSKLAGLVAGIGLAIHGFYRGREEPF